MYEAREQEDILAELQEASTTPASKIEGTFENDMLASNSIEFAKIEVELEQAYKAAFAETSWGDYLTMIAAEFGVDRKLAVKAKGTVTITGTGDVSVGSRFSTAAGTVFETTETVSIQQKGHVPVQAVNAGVSGNVAAGTIVNIPISIPGITGVTNEEPTHDGFDEESDEELLKRYNIIVRRPATSGNCNHYYNWAMSVEGVGECKVVPLWNGAGTVKVIIIDSNHSVASSDLIAKVKAHIEENSPIGATVTVTSPAALTIDITADVKGTLDTDALKTSLSEYFVAHALNLTYISSAQIIDRIMNQSTVEDCDNVLVNGAKRVSITSEQLPVMGSVTIHDLTA